MLRIRQEQMEVFGAAMQRSFELRMLASFRADPSSPTENLSDDEILSTITLGIDRASRYDIVNETDVERYIKYMFIYGPDFDTDPQSARIGEILRADVIGRKKMDRIDEYQVSVTERFES